MVCHVLPLYDLDSTCLCRLGISRDIHLMEGRLFTRRALRNGQLESPTTKDTRNVVDDLSRPSLALHPDNHSICTMTT